MRIPNPFRFAASSQPATSPTRQAAADSQSPPALFGPTDTLARLAEYHLTEIVRSHIEGLIGQLPVHYVNMKTGRPGTRREIHDILSTLTPQALGSYAADVKMLGNGILAKVQPDGGATQALEYHSPVNVSPVITAVDNAWVLHGFKPRPARVHQIKDTNLISGAIGIDHPIDRTDISYWTPDRVVHARMGTHERYGALLGRILLLRARAILDYDSRQNNYTLDILRNLRNAAAIAKVNVPADAIADDDALLQEMERLERQFAGNNGGLVTTNMDTDIKEFTAPVSRFRFNDLYRTPEFRFCAMFDTPAALVGLQAGLENSPWSNLPTLRRYELDSLIQPLADLIGRALTVSLFEEFRLMRRNEAIIVDTSVMPVAQEDLTDKANRWIALAVAGIATEEQAAEALDIPYLGEDDNNGDEDVSDEEDEDDGEDESDA